MDRDYVIDRMDATSFKELIQELGHFGIDARGFEQALLLYTRTVSNYIEDSVRAESEELDLFLGSFKIRKNVEVRNG